MWLLLATAVLPAASCRCSGDPGGAGGPQASGAATGGPATASAAALAEQSEKLPNGLQVDLVSGPCGDTAALVVHMNVGLDHDPPGRSGMARLAGRALATMAPPGRAPRTVETGSDYTLYSVVVPGDQITDELQEVARWMSTAAPLEADLGREREKLLDELGKLAGADAALTALSLAEEGVAPTRGGGKRRGIAAEVSAITLAELTAYWRSHFAAGNARITIAGRFDAEMARAHVGKVLGPLAAGTPPMLRDPGDTTVKGTLVMGEAPSAVAIAVPAPATGDPLFAPFLVLAARLAEKPVQPRSWEASYDPLGRPEVLFITGPVGQAEQAEPAAGRMRREAAAILAEPPSPADMARTRERFRLLVEERLVDPGLCAKDPRAFATARARRARLGIESATLGKDIEALPREKLEEAAGLFDAKRTAAVIAGGAIR